MAIRTFNVFQEQGQGGPHYGPTGCVAGASYGTPPDGYIRLNDERDSTGFLLSGTASVPSGLVFYTNLTADPIVESVPGNTTVVGETLTARAALQTCAVGSLRAYVNHVAISDPVSVGSSFAELSFPLTDAGLLDVFLDYFRTTPTGLVVENDCDSGGAQEIQVSEANVQVDFEIPDPIVETLGVCDLAPNSATLRGSLIVNQADVDQRVGNPAFAGVFSFEFPVTCRMEIGLQRSPLTQTGSTLGPFYGTVAGSDWANPALATVNIYVPLTGLTPNTTYFYRLVAEHEDGEFEGDVLTFTTPITDPPEGVY